MRMKVHWSKVDMYYGNKLEALSVLMPCWSVRYESSDWAFWSEIECRLSLILDIVERNG